MKCLAFGQKGHDRGTYPYPLSRSVTPPGLHTGTETRLTESGVLRELHTTSHRLRALHCWTGSHALSWSHAAQQAARIRIETVWRQSGLRTRIRDSHRTRIQGLVWRAPLFLMWVVWSMWSVGISLWSWASGWDLSTSVNILLCTWVDLDVSERGCFFLRLS